MFQCAGGARHPPLFVSHDTKGNQLMTVTKKKTAPKKKTKTKKKVTRKKVQAKKKTTTKKVQTKKPPISRAALMEVEISKIDDDIPVHRLAVDKERMELLRTSIERDGLQQPIKVWQKPTGGRYSLAFGRLRLDAVKKLGWTHINAFVVPRELYDVKAIALSCVMENVARQELSPVEEALSYVATLDNFEPQYLTDKTLAETSDKIAGATGRSFNHINSILRLVRLCPDVRTLVATGKLPLGHAKIIARIGDHDWQRDVAKQCEPIDGSPGMRLYQVRRAVEHQLDSLRIVPWNLDVGFAGKVPCLTCQHNSNNQQSLFDDKDDTTKPADRCLNQSCFKKKMEHARSAQEKVVADLVRKGDPRECTGGNVTKIAPAFLKPGPIVRAAKKGIDSKISANASKGSTSKTGAGSTPKETKEQRDRKAADRKHQDALYDWEVKLVRAVDERLHKDPLRWALCTLLELHNDAARFGGTEKWFKLLEHPSTLDIRDVTALARDVLKSCPVHPVDFSTWNWEVWERMAPAFGVKVPDKPTLEQFLPKKKVTKKKTTPKKKVQRKKKVTKKKTPSRTK